MFSHSHVKHETFFIMSRNSGNSLPNFSSKFPALEFVFVFFVLFLVILPFFIQIRQVAKCKEILFRTMHHSQFSTNPFSA